MKPKILHREPPEEEEEENLYFSTPKDHLDLISSGCTILDCVVGGGWPLGRMTNIVGDKSTGKSLCAIEAMANFAMQFPEGKATYCEAEAAFDDEYAEALGLDMSRIGRDECETVEDLFDKLTEFIKEVGENGQGLYIVDSLDALSDKAELERKITDSTYGATKPKQLGQLFRRLVKPLEKSNVSFIIISQVRDNIGVSFGAKHTRSGGKALDFYASQIVWLSHTGQLHRTIKGVKRAVGVEIKAKCTKNKIGLPFRECQFEIHFGYGIDDVGASLNFLKETGELGRLGINGTDQAVAAYKKTFADMGNHEQLAEQQRLAEAVKTIWFRVEKSFLPKRGKYVVY